jgi:hypothetical protein
LGNVCERYDRLEEAMAAWLRAAEDPQEMEACISLTSHYAERAQLPEAFAFSQKAIARLRGGKNGQRAEMRRMAAITALSVVRIMLQHTPEPMALSVSWTASMAHSPATAVIHLSSVDLRTVSRWDRLIDLLASHSFVGAWLTPELPEESLTILGCLLENDAPIDSALEGPLAVLGGAVDAPSRGLRAASPKVGRNAPCPCGSRKKFKRCCGR